MSSFRADNSRFSSSPRNPQWPFGPRFDLRFRRQVEAVHTLGPFALACLLEEIAAGADLHETVAAYARLPADFIQVLGGGRFPPALHAIGGGAR
jgi:hypothetical protein